MTVKVKDILEHFPKLLHLLRGDAGTDVLRPCAPSAPEAGCILFLNEQRRLADAVASAASVLVVADAHAGDAALADAPQTVLGSPSPELALALVARTFFPVAALRQRFDADRIHPSAVVAGSAEIAEDAIVGPNAVIGADSRIGAACIIGANTTVESNVVIGNGSHIHANVFIAHGTIIGNNCEIHPTTSLGTEGFGYAHDEQFNHYRHVHYARLILEDDVHVGAGVTIDRGHFSDSVIGRGTKIDNHCHLGHNIRVGRNCLMVADFIAAGTVVIGSNNVFGGRTGISDHVTIGDNMQFTALTSIFKDIDQPGKAFGGHPLQPVNDYLKSYASIAHLPSIRKNVARIMRKLGMA